jgi:hypothetical protein
MAPRKETPTTPTTGTTVPASPSVSPEAYQAAGNTVPVGGAPSSYSNTGVSENYIPFGRQEPGLAGSDGKTLAYYNLSTFPREFLAGMQDEVLRKDFLKNLYERGWYDSKERPGGGLSDEDEKAVYKLMYAANLAGVQWNQIYTSGKKSPFASDSAGGGAGFRPSSTEDLVEIANRTALSTIGRKLSAEETSKFARSYQSSQQAEASGGMSAPSTDVFFKNRIEQKYGAESDGYKYLSAISNVAKLMENM